MRLHRIAIASAALLLQSATAQTIKQVWKQPLPEPSPALSVHKGRVLVRTSKDMRLLDAKSGRTLATLPFSQHAKFDGDQVLLATQVPDVPDYAIEGRSLDGKLVWRVPRTRPSRLGAARGGKLFVTDATGIHRIDIASGAVEQSREVRWGWGPPELWVVGSRVYAGVSGHEVYGLRAEDLSRGWRSYCDASPSHLDATGFVGVGTFFRLASVAETGAIRFAPPGSLSLLQQPVLVDQGIIVVGGNLVGPGLTIQPYLFGLDFKSGDIRWKAPMFALRPVPFKGGVAVLAGHRIRPGEDYGGHPDGNLTVRLELRDLADGRLRYTHSKSWEGGSSLTMVSDGVTLVIADGKHLYGLR